MMNEIKGIETDFAHCVYTFLVNYLSGERNLSPKTVKSYGLTLKLFITFLGKTDAIKPENIRLNDVTSINIRRFLDEAESSGGIKPSTRNQRLAALKTFVRYAMQEHPVFLLEGQRILALPQKRSSTPEIVYLEKDAMKALLAAPDQKSIRGRRDLAILALLYDTGARVQELLDIAIKDIRFSKPATVTLLGKGSKTRTVPIMDETVKIIEAYLYDLEFYESEACGDLKLFRSPNRSQFTRPGITKILKKHYEAAKADNPTLSFPKSIHPHALRASKAIHLLEAGVNIIIIRDFLGHVSVSTTQMYLRVNSRLKKEAINSAYPSLGVPSPSWDENVDLMRFLKDLCS